MYSNEARFDFKCSCSFCESFRISTVSDNEEPSAGDGKKQNGHAKKSVEKVNNENGHEQEELLTNGNRNHQEQTLEEQTAISSDSINASTSNDSNNNTSQRKFDLQIERKKRK